jgi:hypothetical protein
MKPENDDMDANPPSELNAAWPEHRSADLLDRIIVEQWLDSQVAMIGAATGRRSGSALRAST